MSTEHISPEKARAALAEAGFRASQVRRADGYLLAMLIVILVVFVSAAALVSVSSRSSRFVGLAVVAVVIVALASVVVIGFRMRAFSRRGLLLYFGTVIAFNLWNSAVVSVSVGTRFWALGQPSYHFGISEAVGVVPLVVGISLMSQARK